MNTGHREKPINFKRSVGIALEVSWIKMINPECRNSPGQKYEISEGKKGSLRIEYIISAREGHS